MLAEPEGQHLSICAYVIATKQPDLVEKRFIALYTAAQVRAQAGGGKLIEIPSPIIAGAQKQAKQATKSLGGMLAWPGLLRRLERKDPSYRT